MSTTATVAIDRAGRLVVPKAIREEAGIEPGVPLLISVRDGRIEIEPECAQVHVVESHGLRVLDLVKPMPPLAETTVRRISRKLRDRRTR